MKPISKFHILTQDLDSYSHQQQALDACSAGATWIQMRCKQYDFNTTLNIAMSLKKICDEFGAVLIINDFVEIARMVKANGVHVGKEDCSVKEARSILGEDAIIGYSCNTYADIENASKSGANYAGLGPYRFTYTREKLNPILGLEGIKHVMRDYYIQQNTTPVIAIGGITKSDVAPLLSTGVHGVAVSSAIYKAPDRKMAVKEFLEETTKPGTGKNHDSTESISGNSRKNV